MQKKSNAFPATKPFSILILIYMLTAIGLPPGGSSTVHINTQTVHRTQLTTLVRRLSGIQTQSGQTKINDELIHSVFCLTTGPKPPLKRFLHIVRSRASSFK